ncbi:MAG: hypothetical protein JSS82_12380 [Bacteroidetes bacterium]|nr:hypothetical protein [Bacteroidota bacterium]
MSKTLKNIVAPICCLLVPYVVNAQKPFVEGTIQYSVKLSAGAAVQRSGTYLITVKGKQIKKEFRLEDLDNTILINGDEAAYSLKASQGKKYAIQLDAKELMNRSARYADFKVNDETANGLVAGLSTQKAKVAYKDGSTADILYSKDWKPADAHLFEHFPAINGLPLDFTYQAENGALIHFHAEKVEMSPVENAVFRLPKDYRIISNAEYQQLSKQ